MSYFLFFLILFWFIREVKAILFWLYLWQLKEYHLGRFIDHFRTRKGQDIFLNWLFFLKLILTSLLFLYNSSYILLSVIFLLYFFEFLHTVQDLVQKRIKKPVLTKKTVFLIFISFVFTIAFFYPIFIYWKSGFVFWLLIFDILTPAIISAIVLIFQPISVFEKYRLIKKAKNKRKKFSNLLVIGITGSYGKTSTKEFLYTILVEKFGKDKVLKTKEHQNSEVGISNCILKELNETYEIFIVEMGAYNIGGIKLLCNIAQPKIGILTGINEQHMATFGSQENIIKAKFELINSLPEDGLAILNWDNNFIKSTINSQKTKLHVKNQKNYSTKEKVDIWAENIKMKKDNLSFKVFSKDGDSADFYVNLLGYQNVENILAATCCAKELGMNLKEISRACQKIDARQSGIWPKLGVNQINILDSTYSANPNGVLSHLDYLKILPGKKVIVMPCLIELGQASKNVHKKIGQKIGEVCDLAIITTKERFKDIVEGASLAKTNEDKKTEILFLDDPDKIFKKIKEFCSPHDTVILESRVPSKLINYLTKE